MKLLPKGRSGLPRILRRTVISKLGQNYPLILHADQAMARGDARQAESILELAAQRGRDASTLLRLATVRRTLGDLEGALKCAAAAVELEPRNFLMCLLLGSLREATGAIHAAERAYRAACANAPVDLSFQPAMAKQLEHAKRRVRAGELWRERLLEWRPDRRALSAEGDRRMRGFRANLLESLDSGPLTRPTYMIPGIKSKRYFDASEFPGVAELERATDIVRDEFLTLAEGKRDQLSNRLTGLHGAEEASGRTGNWSMIPLIRNGRPVEEFASRCPRTMELAGALEMPKLSWISPSLYFSVLEPNSKIPPHTGITNARLIAHFPLIVPDNCGFRVGNETRQWQVGKAMVFDDMTTHEAWNDSDRIRVVLIADLWRPEFSAGERLAVRELMDCGDSSAEA
jgi:aspartyl/asparaginyl beta-hydroxylase (cupin superfamily)